MAITSEKPFEHDKLGYERLILPLTRLLEKTPGPYVIAVNGDYGFGKTTFLKMWRAFLGNQTSTLYFDAWEHDFIEPPLTALIGEVESQIEASRGNTKVKKRLHKAGLDAIRAVAPVAAKETTKLLVAIAAGTVGGKAVADSFANIAGALAEGDVGEGVGEIVKKLAKDRIAQYNIEKKTLASFRSSLAEFAAAVSGRKGEHAAENRFLPLVFFIDELDRCRPTYAVELLETLKHLFAVPGVVFVLGINKDALAQSLQAIYGQNFPGAEYLRRFIDLQYLLPDPQIRAFCLQLAQEYIPDRHLPVQPQHHYYGYLGIEWDSVRYGYVMAVAFTALARLMGRSLRDLEQIFARGGAVIATLDNDAHIEPTYFAFLLLLHEAYPEIYKKFVARGNGSTLFTELGSEGFALTASDPLAAIILECVACQHQSPEEIAGRRKDHGRHVRNADTNDTSFIAWSLLLNGYERIVMTADAVALASRFD